MHISYFPEGDQLSIQLKPGVRKRCPPIEFVDTMRAYKDENGEIFKIEIDWASRYADINAVHVTGMVAEAMAYITTDEFAEMAGITPSTLRDHRRPTAKSPLPEPVTYVGKSPLWRRIDAERWCETRDSKRGRAPRRP